MHPTPADVESNDAQSRATPGADTVRSPCRVPQPPAPDAQMRNTSADVVQQDATSSDAFVESAIPGPSAYDPAESLYEPSGSLSSGGYVLAATTDGMGGLGDLLSSVGEGSLVSPLGDAR
jgi:hypothetical protein